MILKDFSYIDIMDRTNSDGTVKESGVISRFMNTAIDAVVDGTAYIFNGVWDYLFSPTMLNLVPNTLYKAKLYDEQKQLIAAGNLFYHDEIYGDDRETVHYFFSCSDTDYKTIWKATQTMMWEKYEKEEGEQEDYIDRQVATFNIPANHVLMWLVIDQSRYYYPNAEHFAWLIAARPTL